MKPHQPEENRDSQRHLPPASDGTADYGGAKVGEEGTTWRFAIETGSLRKVRFAPLQTDDGQTDIFSMRDDCRKSETHLWRWKLRRVRWKDLAKLLVPSRLLVIAPCSWRRIEVRAIVIPRLPISQAAQLKLRLAGLFLFRHQRKSETRPTYRRDLTMWCGLQSKDGDPHDDAQHPLPVPPSACG
jgi:hypothetical protein